jgi:hypothetical protein
MFNATFSYFMVGQFLLWWGISSRRTRENHWPIITSCHIKVVSNTPRHGRESNSYNVKERSVHF